MPMPMPSPDPGPDPDPDYLSHAHAHAHAQPRPRPRPRPRPSPAQPLPLLWGECFRREPCRKKPGFSQGGSTTFGSVNLVGGRKQGFRLRGVEISACRTISTRHTPPPYHRVSSRGVALFWVPRCSDSSTLTKVGLSLQPGAHSGHRRSSAARRDRQP